MPSFITSTHTFNFSTSLYIHKLSSFLYLISPITCHIISTFQHFQLNLMAVEDHLISSLTTPVLCSNKFFTVITLGVLILFQAVCIWVVVVSPVICIINLLFLPVFSCIPMFLMVCDFLIILIFTYAEQLFFLPLVDRI